MAQEGTTGGISLTDLLSQQRTGGGGGGGGGAAQGADPVANEDIGKLPEEAAKKIPAMLVQGLEGIPIVGPLLAGLIPLNAGEVSMFTGLEKGATTDRKIMEWSGLGTRGGLLAGILAALGKNPQISGGEAPTADGVAMGDGSFGEGVASLSGGDGPASFDFSSIVNMDSFPTFAMMDIPNSMSGQFSSPQFSEPMPVQQQGAMLG